MNRSNHKGMFTDMYVYLCIYIYVICIYIYIYNIPKLKSTFNPGLINPGWGSATTHRCYLQIISPIGVKTLGWWITMPTGSWRHYFSVSGNVLRYIVVIGNPTGLMLRTCRAAFFFNFAMTSMWDTWILATPLKTPWIKKGIDGLAQKSSRIIDPLKIRWFQTKKWRRKLWVYVLRCGSWPGASLEVR